MKQVDAEPGRGSAQEENVDQEGKGDHDGEHGIPEIAKGVIHRGVPVREGGGEISYNFV